MKKTLLGAALLCGVSLPAQAGYICDSPIQLIGKVGINPVISTSVSMTDSVMWHVLHRLRDGTVIDRSTQYEMTNVNTNDKVRRRWYGRAFKNQDLMIVGEFVARGDQWHGVYTEALYDTRQGNKLVMRSEAYCANPDTTEQLDQPAPTYAGNSVPLYSNDGGHSHHLTVVLGNQSVNMLLDTGASNLGITQSIAYSLVNSGAATWGPNEPVIIADGSTHEQQTVIISRVTLGEHTINNVPAVVSPDGAPPLLGMGVLGRFGRFTIDVANDQLILG